MDGKALTSAQLAELTQLHEALGRLLASLNGSGSGHFKRRGLTSDQSRALLMERFNNERRQKV